MSVWSKVGCGVGSPITGAKKDVQYHEILKQHSRNQQHMKWLDNMQIQEEHVISGIRICSSREDNTASKIPLARVCSNSSTLSAGRCVCQRHSVTHGSSGARTTLFREPTAVFFFIFLCQGPDPPGPGPLRFF